MPVELSRRSLVAATAATALAGPAAARVRDGVAFGPALTEAHLIYNENPYGPAPSAIRAMAEAAAKGCYYVDEIEPKLTAMIAARLRVSPKQIVLGNGSFEVLAAAAAAWGGDGAILSPDLMFDEPLGLAVRGGARRVTVPLGSDMGVDLDALAARIGPDVSMVYLCNPNNPTAMLLDPAALRGFIRAVPPGVTVLVDEAYNELTDAPEAASVVDQVREGANVIISRTFSKLYGMAGLRVGYVVTTEGNARRIRERRATIGLNSAGLAAAIASYNDTAFMVYSRARILEGRRMILEAVSRAGLRALPSQANFVLVEVPDANAVRDAMTARGVAIRGAYGAWSRWSRVSTGKLEHVRRYADALPGVVQKL